MHFCNNNHLLYARKKFYLGTLPVIFIFFFCLSIFSKFATTAIYHYLLHIALIRGEMVFSSWLLYNNWELVTQAEYQKKEFMKNILEG